MSCAKRMNPIEKGVKSELGDLKEDGCERSSGTEAPTQLELQETEIREAMAKEGVASSWKNSHFGIQDVLLRKKREEGRERKKGRENDKKRRKSGVKKKSEDTDKRRTREREEKTGSGRISSQ